MSDRAEREAKLARTYGMSPQATEQLNVRLARLDDWTAKCRRCGQSLIGTLAQIREHNCGSQG